MELTDTHCHIHFPDYQLDPRAVLDEAQKEGVKRLICVGCTLSDSQMAIDFASSNPGCWASIGLHPHEAEIYVNDTVLLDKFRDLANKPKVVAIGETGLDYHYMHSSKEDQKKLFRFQLELASVNQKPLIFHVREAFDDFWKIYDEYPSLTGVIHSFSAGQKELDEILARELYVGLNGIMTFTKNAEQLAAAKTVPLQKLLLETDAPFLTPAPERGTICQPKHVVVTANFLSNLRNESLEELAAATTHNAIKLFGLED